MNIYPLPINDMMKTNIQKAVKNIKDSCKKCNGTGYGSSYTNEYHLQTYKECENCMPKLKRNILYIMSGIPYGYLSINSLHDHLNQKDKDFLKLVIKEFKKNPLNFLMICLASDYKGVGKTGSSAFLLKRFIDILLEEDQEIDTSPITWISAHGFVDMVYQGLNIAYQKEEQKIYYENYMQSVYKNQILFIDGLGDHFVKKNDNSDENFIAGKFESLIRYRQDNNLPIITTSNYTLFHKNANGEQREDFDNEKPSLLKKYGERVIGLWIRGDSFWYDWKTEMPIRGMSHTNSQLANFISGN